MFLKVEKLTAMTPSLRRSAGNLYFSDGTPVITTSERAKASSKVRGVSEVYQELLLIVELSIPHDEKV